MIRILCVDDHAVLREGIASILSCEPDMKLVAEASSGAEAIEQYRATHPDVTLMDLQLPDMTGIDALTAIRSEFPQARIIVLTTFRGDVNIHRALTAGARAYMLKTSIRAELLNAIRDVHAGRKRIPPEVAAELAEYSGAEFLTNRELEILRLVAKGRPNREIGTRLSITEGTVKEHMKNILSKLCADDRTHAVTIALRRGMIQL